MYCFLLFLLSETKSLGHNTRTKHDWQPCEMKRPPLKTPAWPSWNTPIPQRDSVSGHTVGHRGTHDNGVGETTPSTQTSTHTRCWSASVTPSPTQLASVEEGPMRSPDSHHCPEGRRLCCRQCSQTKGERSCYPAQQAPQLKKQFWLNSTLCKRPESLMLMVQCLKHFSKAVNIEKY